jgi:radical SAM superfamily enzyme YgiQ (UPF0313 family)
VKVALIQLPLQSHDYVYSLENIPLAAGYLASYASAENVPADIIICPANISNLGGDAAILRWLEEIRPDMVGFSCYLWNVQRTLHLCSEIRQTLKDCTIVLGGPEVTADNDFLLSYDCFHFGVVGEGEETFADLLKAAGHGMQGVLDIPGLMVRQGSKATFTKPRSLMTNLDRVPSPYLNGMLAPGLNKGMVMETVRGCPMRCAYCYYHKSSPVVRTFRADRIGEELRWAGQKGIHEATIIDPCFARRPDLDVLLTAIVSARSNKLRFSCELIAEDITPVLVNALVAAGLAHVEIGLQSTNEKALRNINRPFARDAFIHGVRLLRSAGVRVMTDIMVGLPGDTLEDVKRSIDFVLAEDLCDDLSLYPLSILPGTKLRHKAQQFGIIYQHEPPYLVTKTLDMDCDDTREAFTYAQEATGRDLFPVELPRMGTGKGHKTGKIVQRIVIDENGKSLKVSADEIGQALCIEVLDRAFLNSPDSLRARVQKLLVENPFTLVSWIIPEEAFCADKTAELIISMSLGKAHPIDSEYMATFTLKRSCQLFLRGNTTNNGCIYTQIPLHPDPSRPIWAALPEDAGPEEEEFHSRHMEGLLGFKPDIRYHDLEADRHDALDEVLAELRINPYA